MILQQRSELGVNTKYGKENIRNEDQRSIKISEVDNQNRGSD